MSIGPATILDVNLTTGEIERQTLPEEEFRLYPGGSALAMYLLLKHLPPGVDPLGPDNILVLAVSPLASLPISGQSRITAAAKSPLTGAAGDSQAGGFFPAAFGATGIHAVMFRGRSPKPVYLVLNDGEAELRDASHLWGKVTADAEAAIKAELGEGQWHVAQCGPAGENQVRFAAIINMSNRANGRTGMGAVMGAKRLKAVAVQGKRYKRPADPALWKTLMNGKERLVQTGNDEFGKYGTAGITLSQNLAGGLPTRNYQSGFFAPAEKIDGKTMVDTILVERDTCHACIVRCKRVVEVPGRVERVYGGPEYETIATFGSYCGVDDLEAIAECNQLCNMYGMDTISCGATVAFAMECFERGILTAKDTGGLELRFGNAEAMVKVTEQIARREGIGDLLAEGSRRAAQRLGPAAEALAIHVKGNEIPAHMPQVKRSLALIYAVNPFGADHQSSEHDPMMSVKPDHWIARRLAQLGLTKRLSSKDLSADKVRFAYYTQVCYSVLDTLGLCQFVWGPSWQLYDANDIVTLCRAGLGWDTSLWELMKIGERRLNLLRAFNTREGLGRKDDRLPERLFAPLPEGRSQGVAVDRGELERALDVYYQMAGWDPEGRPTRWKLAELGLDWVADQLDGAAAAAD